MVVNEVTERIIGCGYTVSNELGPGFLEKVCENALTHELRKQGLRVSQQHPIRVTYDGVVVSEFAADLLIEDAVLVELKAARAIDGVYAAQCLNYLKATGLNVCLLLNFGVSRLQIKRFVF